MKKQYTPLQGIIPLHFNVQEHNIPLSQFINAAKSAQEIIDNFNQELFGGQLKYEIRIVAPQPGGIVELLSVGIVGYIAKLTWEFLQSEVGKAYIKGLTGFEPAYWAEKLGQKTKDLSEIDKKKLSRVLIALMVVGFLQKDTTELQRVGFGLDKFREAYSARNTVYEGCIANPEVQGLGFDLSHDFTFSRADFPRFIVDLPALPEKLELEDSSAWEVETLDLVVNSPNWKRDSRRKWQGSTTEKQDIGFVIEDDAFWHHVNIKSIQPAINDNMCVQWAYPRGHSKLSNARVLRVLTYNGTHISEPLSDMELQLALGTYSTTEQNQADLFNIAVRQ